MTKQIRSRSGFTLVEILAVLAIGGLLLTLLAQILGSGFSIWSKVHGALDTEAEARAALERLGRDLQSYVGDASDGESFRLAKNPDAEGPSGSEAKHADWFVFTAHPMERDMDDPSGICTVSYRLVYEEIPGRESGSVQQFSLLRRIVDSSTTFRDFDESENLIEDLEAISPSQNPEEVIASHVISFQITPIFRTEDEADDGGSSTDPPALYNSTEASLVTIDDHDVAVESDSPPEDSMLHGVRISLSVLRPSGVALVEDGAEITAIAPDHIANFSQIVTFPIPPGVID